MSNTDPMLGPVATCPACGQEFQVMYHTAEFRILCANCEHDYHEYLAAHQPRCVINAAGLRAVRRPQSRHQWATHRK
jgi:uncharacterized protein (DUF983 family)